MSASIPPPAATAELTFEKALEELEALVARMEDGKLPLEESLAAYQRGAELIKFCESQAHRRPGAHRDPRGRHAARLQARGEVSAAGFPGLVARRRRPDGGGAGASSCPPRASRPRRLHDAMRYSMLGGGKRVRAMLVFAAGVVTERRARAPARRRGGGRDDPRLLAHPRRPAVHGRRRAAPRQAHLPRGVRRGHGAARRATRCRASPSSSSPSTGSPTTRPRS